MPKRFFYLEIKFSRVVYGRIILFTTRCKVKKINGGVFLQKKNKWLKWLLGIMVLVILMHVISALTLDRMIEYKEVEFSSEKITAKTDTDGYTIAFVTDTHAIPENELGEVVKKINERNVDVLLLGGDYANGSGAYQTMRILGETKTRDGIYGVDGNHDEVEEIADAMELHGIYLLENKGVYLKSGLYLAGVGDPWNRKPDIVRAVEGATEKDFVLLLSHNPDVSMKPEMKSVDLMLSGHTHGGQITFFGIFAPALVLKDNITRYGQLFMSGWSKTPAGGRVYVSNGTGQFEEIPRVFARPQVIFLTLRSGKEKN